MKIKNFAKSIFNKIQIAYPQNIETRNYLNKLKVKKIKSLGNLKFIEHFNERKNSMQDKINLDFKSKNIWVASVLTIEKEFLCKNSYDSKKNIKI